MKTLINPVITLPTDNSCQTDEPLCLTGFYIMKEIWKDIPGYEKLYQVSNLGRVKSLKKIVIGRWGKYYKPEIIMSQQKNRNGYMKLNLTKDGSIKTILVHRLVAICFLENPLNKKQVNHIDFKRNNNCFLNLEWTTSKENVGHSKKHNRLGDFKGEKHGQSKLTKEQVLEIRKIGKSKTLEEIGREFNISFKHVSQILNRKRWKHI